MSIEPSQAYTVCIRPVMPPKPERIPPQPMLSIEDEAKQVRARFRKTWGTLTAQASGEDANARRRKQAEDRRNELAQRALDLLAEREASSSEMCNLFCASENQMRTALGYMRASGLATFKRKGSGTVWCRIAEAAE